MPPLKNLGTVILGAGASSRMGRPKLLLPWKDSTVVGHLIRQWRELGAGQIAVVHRPNDAPLAAELDRLDFPRARRIENPQPERGMFSSVVCAANWPGWRKEITHWAVVLGDQPHLSPATLRQLLEFAGRRPEAVCQPEFGGRARHPVILPKPALEALRQSPAETLKDFLKLVPLPRVLCSMDDNGLSLDMDTPEDYKQLQVST